MNRCLPIVPLLLVGCLPAQGPRATPRAAAFDAATVQALAELPLQTGGRVKPLGTFAAYTLFQIHGRRDLKLDTDGDGRTDTTLLPTEWLLDVWCFPDQAADYPLFRIENVEALDAIGIAHGGQRQGFEFVSYRQLMTPGAGGKAPGEKLFELGRQYHRKDRRQRSGVEQLLVDTLERVNVYHGLHQQLAVLHHPIQLEGEALQGLFTDAEGQPRELVRFGELVQKGTGIAELLRRFREQTEDPKAGNLMAVASVLASVVQDDGHGPGLFPPGGTRKEAEEWLTLGGLTDQALYGRLGAPHAAMLAHLQQAIAAVDQSERERELRAFRDAVVQRAEQRGEYDKVALEAYYYRASWHYRSLHWFLFGLVVVAAGWLLPRSKLLWTAGLGVSGLALCYLIADIALRSFVRSRPPITNLYDTFLFIAATGVLAALVTELISRRRIALAAAPILGALLIHLARKFEVEDGKDTMSPLIAVLDTNYYLATHVTTINMGYAAGMLAALLGTVSLLLKGFGFRRDDVAFHKSIVRMTYGVTCFGLIFAVFGTIYGGVWANDSWGRFWGWDPKENGALLICLSMIALLHARMSGWVRDIGFCVWAACTGLVVAFSWFHVNLLEVGLHAYGFSSALKTGLFTYYGIQILLIAIGGAGILWQRLRTAETRAAGGAAGAADPVPGSGAGSGAG